MFKVSSVSDVTISLLTLCGLLDGRSSLGQCKDFAISRWTSRARLDPGESLPALRPLLVTRHQVQAYSILRAVNRRLLWQPWTTSGLNIKPNWLGLVHIVYLHLHVNAHAVYLHVNVHVLNLHVNVRCIHVHWTPGRKMTFKAMFFNIL